MYFFFFTYIIVFMNNDINDKNNDEINTDNADEIKIDLDNDDDSIDLGIKKRDFSQNINTNNNLDVDKDKNDLDKNDDNHKDIDIEYEDDIISEEESENPKAYIKKLKDEIKQLKKDKTDLLTNWQKDKAEFINARKRDEETKSDVIKFANQVLINDLLPIIDGYEQAKMQPAWNTVDEAWRKGIETIIDKIYTALQKAGVESYGKEGDDFNPSLYEALGQDKTDDKLKDNKISIIMQKGYKLHDKVIRVALVKVYHFE